jgi:hypothetical protein
VISCGRRTYATARRSRARVHSVDFAKQVFFIGGPIPSGCVQRSLMRSIGWEELPTIPNGEACAICRDNVVANFSSVEASRLPCRHIFHEECVLQWIKLHGRCPYCRGRFHVVDYYKFVPHPLIDRLLSIASQAPALSAALSQGLSGENL